MLTPRCLTVLLSATLLLCIGSSTTQAQEPADHDPASLERWGGGEHVFIARLEAVQAGPVGQSFPPLYTHRLTFVVEEVLRGELKKEQRIVVAHSARQVAEPVFPQGKSCIVSATTSRGGMTANAVVETTEKEIAAAKFACSLPAGWRVEKGKVVSPWAVLGKEAWPEPAKEGVRCSVTGRPALRVGDGATFTVAPVPPRQAIQWTNPDGDGEYRITVTNATDQAIEVPALLAEGDTILWNESLVIVCQGRSYIIPGSKGVTKAVKPARLEPGQSVSTVINALALDGPSWPRGGYRIEFRFCLGEKSATQSFYYMSRHHDVLREKLMKPAGK